MKTAIVLTASFVGLHTENVFLSLAIGIGILCVIVYNYNTEKE